MIFFAVRKLGSACEIVEKFGHRFQYKVPAEHLSLCCTKLFLVTYVRIFLKVICFRIREGV